MRPKAPPPRFLAAWVAANAVAEMLGLGFVFACGLATVHALGEPQTLPAHLSYLALGAVLGAIEGAVVGAGQWLVLRGAVEHLTAREWVRATVAGAVLAWTLGMVPGTVMSVIADPAPQANPVEPSPALSLLAAVALGLLAGLILSAFQWRALRRHVARAGWWLPANAVAWAVGMPWIFWLVGSTVADQLTASNCAIFVLGLSLAGALVGTIHGGVLLMLLRQQAAGDASGRLRA